MFCRKCGKEIPDDSVFCPKCGATVANEKETDAPEPEQDEKTPVKEDNISPENEDSVSIIREMNPKIKSDAKEPIKRTKKKIVPVIISITFVLAAVTAALIFFIPQAGIGFEYERVQDYYVITKYTGNSPNVTIPDTIWFKPVAAISSNAFSMRSDNSNAVCVKLGKNISKIDENAFKDYSSLEELDCSAVQIKSGFYIFLVKANAFENCTNLKKITFPHAKIEIEGSAFKNCSSLEDIITAEQHVLFTSEDENYRATIGMFDDKFYSVIGPRAFEGCTSLKNLSLINTRLENNSFENCTGVTEIIMTGGSLGDIFDENLSWREKALLNPGGSAFKGCTSLKTVELNFLVDNPIPNETFYGCTSLTSVFGANISAIGDNAFKNCVNLSEIELEPYPSDVSETAFEGCTKLNNSISSDSQSKKSKLKDYLGIELAQLTYKEFTQNFGMPDEYYNGKAIYNVGNSQYCVNFYRTGGYMGSSDGFHADSNDQILGLEIYGGKEIDILYGMHLGEPLSYYDNMVDDDLASEVRLGAGDHGASWYESDIIYETNPSGLGLGFFITFLLYPDSMEAYGVRFSPYYIIP